MIEDPGRTRAEVVVLDDRAHRFGREDCFRHPIIVIEHPRVLNPEWQLGGTCLRHFLAIQDCARHPRTVATSCHIVTYVGGRLTGQEAMRSGLIDRRLQQRVSFLDAAVDDADCRRVRVRGNRCHG